MARQLIALLVAALVVLPAIPTRATVLVPADLSELSRSATAIVRGTVLSATPQWADGRRRIETVVSVEVRQALKGEVGRTVSFKVPGGDMGRYRSVMIGAPSFQSGEEVILFLGAQPPALPHLLGLGQGVYRVQRDERSGEARVMSPVLVADAGQATPVRRGDPARRGLSLQEFTTQVREAMAAAEHGRRPAREAGGNRGR